MRGDNFAPKTKKLAFEKAVSGCQSQGESYQWNPLGLVPPLPISDLKQGGDQTQGFRQLRGIITFFYTYIY